MATYQKYNDYIEQLWRAKHDWGTHVFKVALSNGVPDPTHTIRANISELATANGYTVGGAVTTIGISEATGILDVTATDPATWTASGAGITYRYAALYNDTHASDALVCYWDNGSSTTVTAGNTLKVDFGSLLVRTF